MKTFAACLFLCLLFPALQAQDTTKIANAVRVHTAPKIDGNLDDEAWQGVPVSTSFTQTEPDYKKASSQRTEVKIVYDDEAIYIGAYMYDSRPDSILHELGNRDDGDLNSDYFVAGFDTYNKRIDAYYFGVSASGIQVDMRLQDPTFDAVWLSQVKLTDKGWCAEFRIPYSAIRFPKAEQAEWKVEFHRYIRRRRELSRWPFVPPDDPKFLKYYAQVKGISHIQAPTRLSLIPYVSVYGEHSPDYNVDGSYTYSNSLSYGAGADIKYGLNDRFTLDMTLLPDFSQVQSDNKVKNLSYREITYQENRPFFKEGVELFNKLNLFYSRRIGRIPTLHDSLGTRLNKGDVLESDPAQTRLLNSIKLSGRTNSGLGIGVFNAVTDNMFATVRDSSGHHRQILTEPLTNYNILVFDQQLKHSSSVSLINTSVIRDRGWASADVLGLGFELLNKKNNFKVSGEECYSQRFRRDSSAGPMRDLTGYKYSLALDKVGGNLTYGIKHFGYSSTYDQTDMGYYLVNNIRTTTSYVTYDQYVANQYFRNSEISVNQVLSTNFTNGWRTGDVYNLNAYVMRKSYMVYFIGSSLAPTRDYDFFEPRVAGKVYRTRRSTFSYLGLSTDYRRKLALDLKGVYAQFIHEGLSGIYVEGDIGLRYRLNDRVSIFYNFMISRDNYNEGFAAFDTLGNPVFGGRVLNTIENRLRLRYIFNPVMSLTLNARHYWNTGHYLHYYNLNTDGSLSPYDTYSTVNDFSYNIVNVDLVYTWIFSPGSSLSVIYKNAIETNRITPVLPRYDEDVNSTLLSPQVNSISIKFMYYLDYQTIRKGLERRKSD
jgi:hypothetical protein